MSRASDYERLMLKVCSFFYLFGVVLGHADDIAISRSRETKGNNDRTAWRMKYECLRTSGQRGKDYINKVEQGVAAPGGRGGSAAPGTQLTALPPPAPTVVLG